jgi:hypothetical protein
MLRRFLALVAVAVLGTSAPHAHPPTVVVVGEHRFVVSVPAIDVANCREAIAQVELMRNAGMDFAHTSVQYRYEIRSVANGRYRITIALDPAGTVVEIPRYTWPKMTHTEIAARDEAFDDLLAHERGHLVIGTEAVDAFAREEHATTTAVDAQDVFQRFLRDVQARQDGYDAITDHGVHQSRGFDAFGAGGNDVVLRCPRA